MENYGRPVKINFDQIFWSLLVSRRCRDYLEPKSLRSNRYRCLLCSAVCLENDVRRHHDEWHPKKYFHLTQGFYRLIDEGSKEYSVQYPDERWFRCGICDVYLEGAELIGHHKQFHPKVKSALLTYKPLSRRKEFVKEKQCEKDEANVD